MTPDTCAWPGKFPVGTDHAISGPMRGLKNASDGADRQTSGHGNSMTESAYWGKFSENPAYRRHRLSRRVRTVAPIL